jgi:hypothetical protein
VVVQFRGKKVILHCAGYTQAIKRDVFKELVSSNKRYRARNRNVPGIPTPNVDWEVRWEEPIPTPAPNEESFKPSYTGTLKGDDYPIEMDADGDPIMSACLRRTEEIELIPTLLADAEEAA